MKLKLQSVRKKYLVLALLLLGVFLFALIYNKTTLSNSCGEVNPNSIVPKIELRYGTIGVVKCFYNANLAHKSASIKYKEVVADISSTHIFKTDLSGKVTLTSSNENMLGSSTSDDECQGISFIENEYTITCAGRSYTFVQSPTN